MSLRKYSEFITFPIELFNEKVQYDQVPDESAPPPKEGEKQKMKSVPRSVYEWDIMNKMKLLGKHCAESDIPNSRYIIIHACN